MKQIPANVKRAYSTTPWRRKLSIPVLVGLTGIAELTGRSNPAVVANWRTRLEGFPPARSADKHPKFDLVEVLEWYRDQGPRTSDSAPVTMTNVWPLLVAGFHSSASVPAPRESMVSLVLLHFILHRTGDGRDAWAELVAAALDEPAGDDAGAVPDSLDAPSGVAELLARTARRLEAAEPRAEGLLVRQLEFEGADVGYACDLIDALDQLDDAPRREVLWPIIRLDPTRTRSLRATGRRLSGLMVSVAGVPAGGSVLDPACGEGELLIECAERLGHDVTLLGQEVDAASWRIARSRMIVMGVVADLGHDVADSLRRPVHTARQVDAVIVDPPLGADAPALDRWIEFGFGQLRPGGRVVVALPLNELVQVKSARRSPDRRMVSAVEVLAERGLIEGVLVTPPRLRGDVVGPIAIFSFSQADTADRGAEVPVVMLLADPKDLHSASAIDDVIEQFRSGGFAAGRFRAPLVADSVPAGSLLAVLGARMDGVGSRDWASSRVARSDLSLRRQGQLSARAAQRLAGSTWRAIPTPSLADSSVAALELEVAFPEPASSDELDRLARAQREVLDSARSLQSRSAEVSGAAEQLLRALARERDEVPDDVWRRLEPTMHVLRRLVDER